MKNTIKIAITSMVLALLASVGFAVAHGYGGGGGPPPPPPKCSLPADEPGRVEALKSLSGFIVHTASVKLKAGDGDEKFVLVSNHADFSGAVTMPYTPTFNWTLSSGLGLKTVYLRYLNSCKLMPSRATSVSFLRLR